MKPNSILCPCGSNKPYPDCCAPYLANNATARDAEALMRSRYTAYTLLREDYLLATWSFHAPGAAWVGARGANQMDSFGSQTS